MFSALIQKQLTKFFITFLYKPKIFGKLNSKIKIFVDFLRKHNFLRISRPKNSDILGDISRNVKNVENANLKYSCTALFSPMSEEISQASKCLYSMTFFSTERQKRFDTKMVTLPYASFKFFSGYGLIFVRRSTSGVLLNQFMPTNIIFLLNQIIWIFWTWTEKY